MSYFPPRSSSFCFFSRLVLPHPFLPVSFCLVGYNFGLVILSSFSSFLMVVVVGRWLLLVWDLVVTTGGSMLMLSLWCGSVSSSHFCFWLIAGFRVAQLLDRRRLCSALGVNRCRIEAAVQLSAFIVICRDVSCSLQEWRSEVRGGGGFSGSSKRLPCCRIRVLR
ncbi:unnamed protein product [Microthlaspi erraticum]|uniref:Transmembrane protein n=1 Tax=Microthlaspi erraticum TaxID=1685480 RepID=A0A6D2KZ20_9BRAS|nr:unnamed protein product [Microthlaspi erraticum]